MARAVFVYLAGKISINNWRKHVVRELRGHVIDVHGVYNVEPAETYIETVFACGPFFISCDHGCYHGHESHGVGAYDPENCAEDEYPGQCEGAGVPSSIVPWLCKEQINRSDFVFAYIDSATCYGTLLEIGYAIGIGKPVFVMFANNELRKDMWFIAESANMVFVK